MNMKKNLHWFSALAILVIIFGTIYAVVQQSQRLDANDPQIRLAEDTAEALNNGVKPTALPQGKVDMNKSLAPFVIIYDTNGEVVTGNGYLNNEIPKVPKGVLTSADDKEYNAVTWQPTSDLRFAAVTVKANGFYVLGGKSLRQVEKNETRTLLLTFLGGIAAAAVLGGAYILFHSHDPSAKPAKKAKKP